MSVLSVSTLKHFITLFSGSSVAMLLPLLFAPILTRIYTPEEYGVLGIYMALAALFSVCSTFQYSQAVLFAETELEAEYLVSLCLYISVTAALIIFLCIVVSQSFLTKFHSLENIIEWSYYLPLVMLLGGVNSFFVMWANRFRLYRAISIGRIITPAFTIAISIILGLLGFGSAGLIYGFVFGQLVTVICLYMLMGACRPRIWRSISSENLKLVAIKYRKFAFYSFPAEFINQLSNQIPVYFLSMFYSPAIVGLFNRGRQILGLFVTLLAGVVGPIFKEKANSDYVNNGHCFLLYTKTAVLLLALAVFPFSILLMFAEDIFAFVFGENWREAGEFARILVVMYLMKFVTSPLANIFPITGRQAEDFLCHIYMVVSSGLSIYLAHLNFGTPEMALVFFSINFATIYIYYLVRGYVLSLGRNA